MKKIGRSELRELIKTTRQADIAKQRGITREYVRQMVKEYGLKEEYKDIHFLGNRCIKCGEKMVNHRKHRLVCSRCNVRTSYDKLVNCKECGEPIEKYKRTRGMCLNCYGRYQDRKNMLKRENIINSRLLRYYRVSLGLTQFDFAKKIKASPGMVAHYETGRSKVKPEILQQIPCYGT